MSRSSSSSFVLCLLGTVLLLLGVAPAVSFAGMPMPLPDDVLTVLRLREDPAQRVQVISFFILGLLLAALVVKWLWNGLRREFSNLPRLDGCR